MLDKCTNPECSAQFDYKQGRYFRFRRACAANQAPANTHSVEHFWLCGRCAETHALQYHKEHGVVIRLQHMAQLDSCQRRVIRAT